MFVVSKQNAQGIPTLIDEVQNSFDFIDSYGVLHEHAETRNALVRTADDLDLLVDYPVGAIAYTAGYKKMWQLDAFGEWQIFVDT